uniref:Uncharacterized protein n=1 Tax=Arundo donax TaxID=35708 RepID=A0A0A9HWY2_ARUDO
MLFSSKAGVFTKGCVQKINGDSCPSNSIRLLLLWKFLWNEILCCEFLPGILDILRVVLCSVTIVSVNYLHC